jgi:alpha-1,3-rhamnosyl/mannosyltransferase
LLLFPSLYEGFGLPILEAFQYDCPVVTSNNSGMTESGGDAATFVDPYSVESIAEGIEKTIKHKNKAERSKRMKNQLAKFSWDAAATATLKVYKMAIRDGVPASLKPTKKAKRSV